MSQVKDVQEIVCADLNLYDPETKQSVMPAIQRAWYKVIKKHAWQFCRRSTSLSYTSADTNGALLPANMVGLISPLQDSSEDMYFETSPHILPPHNNNYWYYLNDVEVTPLIEEATSLTIQEGAESFTWTGTWSADYVGEYVKFGAEPGLYLIDGTKAISSKYWGPRIAGGAITIRPRECKRVSFLDGGGTALSFSGTVHYWAFPPPLYHEWQTFPDHLFEPVKWATMMEVKGFTVDAKRGLALRDYQPQFNAAINEAITLDPSPRTTTTQRDNRGKRRTLGRRD